MNIKTLMAATCCLLPVLTLADTRMDQGKGTCHFIHNRAGDVETMLNPCYVTFNGYSANRIYYAYGYAERKNSPAGLIPRWITPPTQVGQCVRSRQWHTVDCNLFDGAGGVWKSREGGINVQVCKSATNGRYGDGPYDIFYRLVCKHGFRLNRAQAMAVEQAQLEAAEAASVQDDTIPVYPAETDLVDPVE